MKHLSAITFMIILLAASDSFAHMRHGMMRDMCSEMNKMSGMMK